MAENKNPYNEIKSKSYSDKSLRENIDSMVSQGRINEEDAYDYYRDLKRHMYEEDSFLF